MVEKDEDPAFERARKQMTLTHELAETPIGDEPFERRLEKLISDGFELLKDLTGRQPEAFAGLYLGWYAESSGMIRQLAPARLDEFSRLYRVEKRRRLDYETYVIEDYLMGVSLHGGFGNLDAMRAIAARRFHMQLLLLKSLEPSMRRGLDDLRTEIARDLARTLLHKAQSAQQLGKSQSALDLASSALQLHVLTVHRRHNLKPPKNPSLTISGRSLVRAGVLGDEYLARLEQIDALGQSSHVLEAETNECLIHAAQLVDQIA